MVEVSAGALVSLAAGFVNSIAGGSAVSAPIVKSGYDASWR